MSGYFLGLDSGSSYTKAVVLDAGGGILGFSTRPTGLSFEKSASAAREEACAAAGLSPRELRARVFTGYGRESLSPPGSSRTEISCHGRGAWQLHPGACVVIDIGGQDNKVIALDDRGRILRHRMNRKCAAGTGSFLEEIARKVGVGASAMDAMARAAEGDLELNSFCTVFAGTEVIEMARRGVGAEEIVRAAYNSIVSRITEMAPLRGKILMTGGVVAHHPLVPEILSSRLDAEVLVPPQPQLAGALGAALFARDEVAE